MIDIETIREESDRPGVASTLDGLLEAHWCEEEDLLRAAEALSSTEENVVVTFFQLPFRLKLPEKWLKVPYPSKPSPLLFVRSTGTQLNTLERSYASTELRKEYGERFTGLRHTWNAELHHDSHGLFVRTQVLLSIKLWGYWNDFYSGYLQHIRNNPKHQLSKYHLKTREENLLWTTEIYEVKLARRVQQLSLDLLHFILPAYRVACRDSHARFVNYLDCFFMMNQHGRLIPLGRGESELERNLVPFSVQRTEGNAKALLHRLATRPVNSIYEDFLLNAIAQADLGRPELAVVQTVMTLEWFLNEIIADWIVRPIQTNLKVSDPIREFVIERVWGDSGQPAGRSFITLHEKYSTFLPLAGIKLSSTTLTELQKLIRKRNDIVHHVSRCQVSVEEAHWGVEVGLRVIEETMAALQERSKPNGERERR